MKKITPKILCGAFILLFWQCAGCTAITQAYPDTQSGRISAVSAPRSMQEPVPPSQDRSSQQVSETTEPEGSGGQAVSEPSEPFSPVFSSAASEEKPAVQIVVGDQVFTVVLYDNPSAGELAEQMPFTYTMQELNGNEKYVYIQGGLTVNPQPVDTIHTGDLMLYGPDCLVLFYESFSSSYSYTRIGFVENPEGLKEALGEGNVSVAFSVQ